MLNTVSFSYSDKKKYFIQLLGTSGVKKEVIVISKFLFHYAPIIDVVRNWW